MSMNILVDLDGVLADWNHEYDAALDRAGEPGALIPRSDNRLEFNLFSGLQDHERRLVTSILESPHFYKNLRPIDGAKQAMKEMIDAGHDVRIVTSPWISNPTCASDKFNWVLRHIGQSWGKRTIVTVDKTFVTGDFLIDDKPEVKGARRPDWEHIYFTQPVNADKTGKRRITNWSEWKEVIEA